MGVFSQAARIGCIAAPFMLMLGAQLQIFSPVFIPYVVFGSISCLAELLVLLLPETLGAEMPESMADLQQLQSIFSAQPWRQGCMGVLAFIFRTRAATAGQPGAATPAAHAGCQSYGKAKETTCSRTGSAPFGELASDEIVTCRCDSRGGLRKPTQGDAAGSLADGTPDARHVSFNCPGHEQAQGVLGVFAAGVGSAVGTPAAVVAGGDSDEDVVVTVVMAACPVLAADCSAGA